MNYKNTIIYKIICNDEKICDCYVGHTTNFIKRKSDHKRNTLFHTYKIYEFIRNNGGWENFTMLEIELYPCENKTEARIRERYWYETLNSKLNTNKPISTKQERDKCYNDTHKEERKIRDAKNREHINEVQMQYYHTNKEKIVNRQSYKDNAKKQNDNPKHKEPIICECGLTYTYKHKARHILSKKHQDGLLS